MKNPFEHLRIDTKDSLLEPWYDYPVLKDFNRETIYKDGREHIYINTGLQDGKWVVSVDLEIKEHGFSYYPGRKWGEFESRENAQLWALGSLLEIKEITGIIRKLVYERIDAIRQLSLFLD